MKRNLHSHSSRSGLTGGWLLAVLAVLAILVIIVLFVWRPGGAPGGGPTPATPTESQQDPPSPDEAAEDEAGIDEVIGFDEADEEEEVPPVEEEPAPGEDDAAPADGEPAPADGEEPEAADDAGGVADDAAADDGEEPAQPDGEDAEPEDPAAEPEDPDAAEQEAPGPVDATVETDEPLQADVRNREAEFGEEVATAAQRMAAAITNVEERLTGLERGTIRSVPEVEDLEATRADEPAAADARVTQVGAVGAAPAERTRSVREAAAGPVRTEPEGAEAAVRLDAPDGGDAPASEARVIELGAGDRVQGALERARTGPGELRTRPSEPAGAARDPEPLSADGGAAAPEGAGEAASEPRSVVVDTSTLRDRLETYERRTRESLGGTSARPANDTQAP